MVKVEGEPVSKGRRGTQRAGKIQRKIIDDLKK
jgi:hypothetical protein